MDKKENLLCRLSGQQISAFLRRIGVCENLAPNIQSLRHLHVSHTMHVPFETLDIFEGKQFSLSLDELYEKIVNRFRGGYCYELNGLFFHLLKGLGFDVTICNAHLYDRHGEVISSSQHMILLIKLEALCLVDVGYGNAFKEPLLLDVTQPSIQGSRIFRCINSKNRQYIIQENKGDSWESLYVFTKSSKTISDFENRNRFHQKNRESVFFGKRICKIMCGDEKIELVGNTLVRETPSKKYEFIVEEKDIPFVLEKQFGIRRF